MRSLVRNYARWIWPASKAIYCFVCDANNLNWYSSLTYVEFINGLPGDGGDQRWTETRREVRHRRRTQPSPGRSRYHTPGR